MKKFVVILKTKKDYVKDFKNDLSHLININNNFFYILETYQITIKYIIETSKRDNIYNHFKNDNIKIININETRYKNKNTDKLTFGDLFKEHLVEYSEKYCDKPYLKIILKKELKRKLIHSEQFEYKKRG